MVERSSQTRITATQPMIVDLFCDNILSREYRNCWKESIDPDKAAHRHCPEGRVAQVSTGQEGEGQGLNAPGDPCAGRPLSCSITIALHLLETELQLVFKIVLFARDTVSLLRKCFPSLPPTSRPAGRSCTLPEVTDSSLGRARPPGGPGSSHLCPCLCDFPLSIMAAKDRWRSCKNSSSCTFPTSTCGIQRLFCWNLFSQY